MRTYKRQILSGLMDAGWELLTTDDDFSMPFEPPACRWPTGMMKQLRYQRFGCRSAGFPTNFPSFLGASARFNFKPSDSVRHRCAQLAMYLVGVAVDGNAMFVKLQDSLPLWFRIFSVGQIPVATALAGLLWARFWRSETASAGTRVPPR